MATDQKARDFLADVRAKRNGTESARTPKLGEARGTSGRRYWPAGVPLGALAAKVGLSIAELERLNGRSLATETGPAWLVTARAGA